MSFLVTHPQPVLLAFLRDKNHTHLLTTAGTGTGGRIVANDSLNTQKVNDHLSKDVHLDESQK